MMGIYPCKEEEEEEEKQGRGDNNRTGKGESNPFLLSFVLARPRSPAERNIDQWVDRTTLFYFLSFCAESWCAFRNEFWPFPIHPPIGLKIHREPSPPFLFLFFPLSKSLLIFSAERRVGF